MANSYKSVVLVAVLTGLCMINQPAEAARRSQPSGPNQRSLAGQAPFTVALSAVRDEVQPGGAVELKIVTTNTSTRDLYFSWPASEHGAVLGYSYNIHDGN